MTPVSRELSEKIAFWSFAFSFGVVVIHCAWTSETELGRLLIVLFKETLARLGVPFFFACSGFFLARHFEEDGWWRREMRKRLVSLLVPYVVWSLALAVVVYAETRVRLGIGDFGFDLRRQPALTPLWYVRCLMVFVALSPAFRQILRRGGSRTLLASYCALLAFSAVMHAHGLRDTDGIGGFLHYGFSVEGLFYFLCGMYLQDRGPHALSRRLCLQLLSLGLALTVLRLWLAHLNRSIGVGMGCFIVPLTLAGVMGFPRAPRLPAFLRGCAFPVYLMHVVVLMAMRLWSGRYQTCNPWLELAAGTVVPVVFCNALRRLSPRMSALLFGGRA